MKTISFSEDHIDSILAGKKMLTIQPIKPQPELCKFNSNHGGTYYVWGGRDLTGNRDWLMQQCPHGKVGDVIGVEERNGLRLRITDIDAVRMDPVFAWQWSEDGLESEIYWKAVHKHWQSFYSGTDYDWENKPYVWVIRFEVKK